MPPEDAGAGGPMGPPGPPPGALDLLARHGSVIEQAVARYRWYSDPATSAEDLRQEALIGFLAAVRTFDPARGGSFRAYARACADNAVAGALRRQDPLPEGVRRDLRALREAEDGRPAANAEPEEAALGGLSQQRARHVRDLRARCAPSLGAAYGDAIADIADRTSTGPEEAALAQEETAAVRRGLQSLTPRQRLVVQWRTHVGLSNDAIAARLEVSPGRASQIWSEALAVLREALRPEQAIVPRRRPRGADARRLGAGRAPAAAEATPPATTGRLVNAGAQAVVLLGRPHLLNLLF